MIAVTRGVAVLVLAVAAGCADTAPTSPDAELLNTYWKILSMAGEPVAARDDRREPQLILRSADGVASWSATVGCNQMSGGLTVDGGRINFKPGISTLMACPPPLDTLEKQLSRSLGASIQWSIEGQRLELRDESGAVALLCEAVYLER
jgi:putative lipoprotein